MHPGEKVKVIKETTVLERAHHVGARVKNERGDMLFVDARWKGFETPTFTISTNYGVEIANLYADDLSLITDLCHAALEGVIEIKKKEELS